MPLLPKLLAVAIVAATAQAQSTPLPTPILQPTSRLQAVRTWRSEDGLPTRSVTALAKDREGFLWIGTAAGLARYDGHGFRVFTTADTPELPDNRITALLVDGSGTLWIGTQGRGITRYRDRAFATAANDADGPTRILQLQEGPDGVIWVVGERLHRFAQGGWRQVLTNHERLDLHAMTIDASGTLWVAGDQGLYRRSSDAGGLELVRRWPKTPLAFVYTDPSLGVVSISAAGVLSHASNAAGIDVALADARTQRPARIYQAIRSNGSGMLLATSEGLYTVEFTKQGLHFAPLGRDSKDHLGGNVRCLLTDGVGLWAGNDPGGVTYLAFRATLRLDELDDAVPPPQLSLADNGRGGLWIASDLSDRLWRWLPGQRCTPESDAHADRYPGQKAMITRSDGAVVLRGDEWLAVRTAERTHWIRDARLGRRPEGSQLCEDQEGTVWFGSTGALHRLRGLEWQSIPLDPIDGIPWTPRVLACADAAGLWCSDGRRLGLYTDVGFREWPDTAKLPREQIRWLHATTNGDLWLASYGGGLVRIRGGDVARITAAHGLPDPFVSRVAAAANGDLFLNTNRGAFSIKREDADRIAEGNSRFLTITPWDSQEANGNGGCMTRQGLLALPTIGGIALLDTRQAPKTRPTPTVALLSVERPGGESLPANAPQLTAEMRDLTFRFAPLDLVVGKELQCVYRMKDMDFDWQPTGSDRFVRYAGMPPGKHRFEVAALDTGGAPGRITAFEFEIPPYWHERQAVRAAAMAACLLALLGGFGFKLRSNRRRRRVLEAELVRRERMERALRNLAGRLIRAQELERSRIARDLHDDLNQQVSMLAIDIQLAQRKLGLGPGTIPSADLQRAATTVQDLSVALHRIAHELRPGKLQGSGLFAAVRELLHEAERRDIEVRWQQHGEVELNSELALGFYRIAQESLQNALRHGHAKSLTASLSTTGGELCFILIDDGCGFEVGRRSEGMGLLGMEERLRALGGRLLVQSQPGQGTQITAVAPLATTEEK